MAYIVGQVLQQTANGPVPCLGFQAQCINDPSINSMIFYSGNHFWCSVIGGWYTIQVTTGASIQDQTTPVLSDFSGQQLSFVLN